MSTPANGYPDPSDGTPAVPPPGSGSPYPPPPPPAGWPGPTPPPAVPGPAYGVPGGKPDNYLVWALLSLLFCCLPTGIVSVVYAAKVDGPWSSGLYAEASAAAQTAKKWAIAGPTAAVVSGGTYTLLMLVLAAASESGNS